MLDATPRDSNQQARHAANEEYCAQPVNSFDLLLKREFRHRVKAHEQDRNGEADTTEWIVDVKCPSPGCAFHELTANYWTDDGSNTPASENHREVFRALSQWYDVAKDDLCQRYNPTTANSLDASPSEQLSEVVCDRA